MQMEQTYSALPEVDKAGARVGMVQALKALEFSNAEEMVRKPMLTVESCLAILPPEEAEKLKGMLAQAQLGQQAGPGPVQQAEPGQQAAGGSPALGVAPGATVVAGADAAGQGAGAAG